MRFALLDVHKLGALLYLRLADGTSLALEVVLVMFILLDVLFEVAQTEVGLGYRFEATLFVGIGRPVHRLALLLRPDRSLLLKDFYFFLFEMSFLVVVFSHLFSFI